MAINGKGGMEILVDVKTKGINAARKEINGLSDDMKKAQYIASTFGKPRKERDRPEEYFERTAKKLHASYEKNLDIFTETGKLSGKFIKDITHLSPDEYTRLIDKFIELYNNTDASPGQQMFYDQIIRSIKAMREEKLEAIELQEKIATLGDRNNRSSGFVQKLFLSVHNLVSENRKLSFTEELFNGISGALGKMVSYTKIMSSSLGLVKSGFGFLIDMIFLPLLPIVLAVAEGLFSIGEAVGNALDYISSINPVLAQIISLGALLAGAFVIFLSGQLLTSVLKNTNAAQALYDIWKKITGLSPGLGYGATTPTTVPTTAPTGSKSPKGKTPKGGGKIATTLGKYLPMAGTLLGSAGLGALAGTGIVSLMQTTGVVDILNDFGKGSGIQEAVHAGREFNLVEKTINVFGDMTNWLQESVLGTFLPDFEVRLATTEALVNRALDEGLYNEAVQNLLDTKLGKNAVMYIEEGNPLGLEGGWYVTDKNYQPVGSRQTSYSSVLSATSSINYTTNYNNTTGNGAFDLSNIAGL